MDPVMPRVYPPRRTLIGVRLAPAGLADIDEARTYGQIIAALLAR